MDNNEQIDIIDIDKEGESIETGLKPIETISSTSELYLKAGAFRVGETPEIFDYYEVSVATAKAGNKRFQVRCTRCSWKGIANITQLKNHLYGFGTGKKCSMPFIASINKSTESFSISRSRIISMASGNATAEKINDFFQVDIMKKRDEALLMLLSTENLPFSIVSSPFLQHFIQTLYSSQQPYRLPDRHDIPNMLIGINKRQSNFSGNVFAKNMEYLKSECDTRGITLIFDSWTNVNKHVTTCFHATTGSTSYFIDAFVDINTSKTSEYYIDKADKVVQELENHGINRECIVAIVSDGASACLKASRYLGEKYNILDLHCLVHAFNTLCQNICNNQLFREMTPKLLQISFLFRKHSQISGELELLGGNQVPRLSETRFVSIYSLVCNVDKQIFKLRNALDSENIQSWLQKSNSILEKVNEVLSILRDEEFIFQIKFAKAYLCPLVFGLRLLDSRKPIIGYVYPLFRRVRDEMTKIIMDAIYNEERFIEPKPSRLSILKAISADPDRCSFKQFMKSDRSIYIVVFMLNPFMHREAKEEYTNGESDAINCFESIAQVFLNKNIFNKDVSLLKLKIEFNNYILKKNEWSLYLEESKLKEYEEKVYPVEWWEMNGINPLKKLGMIIHSIIPVESYAETVFSIWSAKQTKLRNRLDDNVSKALVRTGISLRQMFESNRLIEVSTPVPDKESTRFQDEDIPIGVLWNKTTSAFKMSQDDWNIIANWSDVECNRYIDELDANNDDECFRIGESDETDELDVTESILSECTSKTKKRKI